MSEAAAAAAAAAAGPVAGEVWAHGDLRAADPVWTSGWDKADPAWGHGGGAPDPAWGPHPHHPHHHAARPDSPLELA